MSQSSWDILATQAPFVVVIAILMIYVLRHLERYQNAMMKFLSDQAEMNRGFINDQQVQHTQGVARLAEEIKTQRTDTIKELTNLTQRVDSVIDKAIMLDYATKAKSHHDER